MVHFDQVANIQLQAIADTINARENAEPHISAFKYMCFPNVLATDGKWILWEINGEVGIPMDEDS